MIMATCKHQIESMHRSAGMDHMGAIFGHMGMSMHMHMHGPHLLPHGVFCHMGGAHA